MTVQTTKSKARIGRIIGAVLVASVGLAATSGAAFADWQHDGGYHHEDHRGWHHHWRRHWHREYYPPPPVYYAPPPPAYYAPPVYYGPPSFSFGVNIPLNH